MNIAITATVRTLSGTKNRNEVMLSILLKRENQVAQRAFDQVDDGLRIEAENDDQCPEWIESEALPPVDVGQRRVRRVQLAEHHPLDRPEIVRGGDDHAERRDDGERLPLHQRAQKDGELADEPAQPGKAQRGEEGEA